MAAVYWFRRDLRLTDNPALTQALADHDQLLLVYDAQVEHKSGAASLCWLDASLRELTARISAKGGRLLVFKRMDWAKWVAQHAVTHLYINESYDPWVDESLEQVPRTVQLHRFGGHLLHEPSQVRNQSGGTFKVFTPFWKQLQKQGLGRAILPEPPSLSGCLTDLKDDGIDALALLPNLNWHQGFVGQPGEIGAWQQLQTFLQDGANRYAKERDIPIADATSRLSAHLHFGEISPANVLASAIQVHGEERSSKFASELGWREFSYYLLHHQPSLPWQNVRSQFDGFDWKEQQDEGFERWCRGKTGVPLVDAGMRELWHTGVMHNRVRMVVASYLTKNLGYHWRLGAQWFWDTLTDADLASNSASWQWVAGSGADAAPYFRIFNPETQQQKFDAEGRYCRQWLKDSELKLAPWVNLKASREAALERYQAIRVAG